MRSTLVRLVFLFVFVVSLGSASAGTVNLSSGSIEWPNLRSSTGGLHLVGDRRFTADGLVDAGLIICDDCVPGDTINVGVRSTLENGHATLDGATYPDIGSPTSNNHVSLGFEITGEVVAPPFGSIPTATLVVPVTFTGSFVHEQSGDLLVAGAIATVTLFEQILPTGRHVWLGQSVAYDIVAISSNVVIDIKSKTIKADSRGNVSVVIKSSDIFDPTTIDTSTLRFGETGQEQSLVSCARKQTDVNRDGVPDLTCSFAIDEGGFQKGDTIGVLTGETFDNTHFQGIDSVQVR